jgi:Flp pilus assembly pilin Flp
MRGMINFLYDESGQGMVEYGLIVGLVILAGIMAITLFGDKVKQMYDNKVLHDALERATLK